MMKRFLFPLCLFAFVFLLGAQDCASLVNDIPSDSAFAVGINVEKLRAIPFFKKYIEESDLAKSLKPGTGSALQNPGQLCRYVLVSSRDILNKSCDIQMLIPDNPEIRKAMIQEWGGSPVKYGDVTAYRGEGGMEYMFSSKDRLVFSTSPLSSFLSAKKGLSAALKQVFSNASGALANGFFTLPDELKQSNPMASNVLRILFSAVPDGAAKSDIRLLVDAVCANADAAHQTMMLVQQLQLLFGMFINNIDPDLAQEFNRNAVLKTDGNNVRLQCLFTEKLVQKLASADPSSLKGLMSDDSNF